MAVIAKFISYDGGIAYSDSVLKFQKRGSEGVLIPIGSVASVNVRKPQPEADGVIRVQTTDGKRYLLGFAQSQYAEAIRFKRQYTAHFSPAEEPEPAPAPRRTARQSVRVQPEPEYEPEPDEHSTLTRVLLVLVIITALAAAALAVYIFVLRGGGPSAGGGSAETCRIVSISVDTSNASAIGVTQTVRL